MPATSDIRGYKALLATAHLLADPLAATRSISEKYGPFAAFYLSEKRKAPIIHVTGDELAKEILANFRIFHNGGIILKGYSGSVHNKLRQGYFSANEAEYDHYIALFGPLFRKKIVNDVHPVICETVAEQLAQWPSGEPIDIVPRVNAVMKQLASRAMFRDPDIVAGLHAADMVEQHGRLSGASFGTAISAKYGRPAYSHLHRQAQRTYDAIVAWGRSRSKLDPSRDVLSAIVNAPDEQGQPASDDRVAGYGWTMLGASYDTSTSILTWLFVLLATHPEVARKLHEEVAGYDPITPSNIDEVMALPYLDAVIKEALRLIPPAPMQRRKATVETELGGYAVPAGSQMIISAWMTNRDAALYPDPDRFIPERWDGLSRSPYQWLTFSAGPRRCLGIWFALAFLKTIVAGAMARWRPDIPDGAKVSMKVSLTVRPKGSVPIVLRPCDNRYRASRLSGNIHRYIKLQGS